MIRIDTPLLVVGTGPAALVVAKVAAGAGLPCLLAGHETTGDDAPVELDADAIAALERHRLVDVLRPYLEHADPLTIATSTFEEVIKHHCVADLNVVVYDDVTIVDRTVEHVGQSDEHGGDDGGDGAAGGAVGGSGRRGGDATDEHGADKMGDIRGDGAAGGAVGGDGLRGVLTDGTSRWELVAERFVDASTLPTGLSAAIVAGAAAADAAIAAHLAGATATVADTRADLAAGTRAATPPATVAETRAATAAAAGGPGALHRG